MKKLYRIITICCLIFALTFLAGCSFVDTSKINTENEGGNQSFVTVDGVALKNSLEKTIGISFTSAERESQDLPYSSVEETIENTLVNRASVSIIIESKKMQGTIGGSGVIVDLDDGIEGNDSVFYCITCHHVVEYCEQYDDAEIFVYIPDTNGNNFNDTGYNEDFILKGKIGGAIDETQAVSLIGGDKNSDIALIRLNVPSSIKNDMVKAKIMKDNYSVKLGESVFAIGNARGSYPGWITTGNIADNSYEVTYEGIGNLTLLGINVEIFPGNSGGGLFNLYGELIGITNGGVAISLGSSTTITTGINYAIPHKVSDDKTQDKGFINIITQLLGTYKESNGNNYGYVSGHRPLMGFSITQGETSPVIISEVLSGGTAEKLGMKVDDIVTNVKINGQGVSELTYENVVDAFSKVKIGDKVVISVKRYERVATSYWRYETVEKTYDLEFVISQSYFCNTGVYTNISA